MVRVRVRVGLGLGLGASESYRPIADCRQGIPADRLPVAGYRYTTFPQILLLLSYLLFLAGPACATRLR